MKCISPLTLKTHDKVENVTLFKTVPCGKCNYCLQKKRAEWSFRLLQEYKQADSAVFLTMTYAEDSMPVNDCGYPQLVKRDVQLFTKRLRKASGDVQLRYYTVGEYGTKTLRPHYHSIMFNVPPNVLKRIQTFWPYGHIHVGTVTPASIHYTTKYVINRHGDFQTRSQPFSLMSKRPGIGSSYLHTHKHWHINGMRTHTMVNGVPAALPRYYKDKFFTPAQRARLSAEFLELSVEQYNAEIERLSKYHHDPYAYYDEVRSFNHDQVTNKVNALNKI